jgi:heterodisulfide reductase subunit C
MATKELIKDLDREFKYEVTDHPGGENLRYCFSCGTCTATCPVAEVDEDYNPRKIIRMALLGMKKEVLSSELLWQCASCFACFARCPQNVKVADLMKALREMAVEGGYAPKAMMDNIDAVDSLSHRIRLEILKSLMEKGKLHAPALKERISGLIQKSCS